MGDTSLHMSLTGDARFFEYAAQGQITINVALAQYPADEDFDFEGSDQISLGSAFRVTEAFSGRGSFGCVSMSTTAVRGAFSLEARKSACNAKFRRVS